MKILVAGGLEGVNLTVEFPQGAIRRVPKGPLPQDGPIILM